MKVLLLGGTGTLSTAICKLAIQNGIRVSVLNRGNNNCKLPSGVQIFVGDFKDEDSLRSCLSDGSFDVVVDFLSRIPSDIERVYSIFANFCRQYIFISSSCVYCRAVEDFPITETSPKPNTLWKYNIEKYECEQKLIELASKSQSYYTIVRPYITYNEERIPFGLAPAYKYHKTIIERLKAGKPWFTWDNGLAHTTVTFSDDFAEGVVGLFQNEKAINEDFHITSNFCYTQIELIEKVFMQLSLKPNVISFLSDEIGTILPEYHDMLKGDRSLDAVFDNSKIKNAVPGLTFKTSFDEGIKKVISFWDGTQPVYDYSFDARIDKLLSKKGIKVGYMRYPGADKKSLIVYVLYRYFPLRIANILHRWI